MFKKYDNLILNVEHNKTKLKHSNIYKIPCNNNNNNIDYYEIFHRETNE